MKYAPIIWAGLRRKPVRSFLTFLSVATAFLLYGGLSGAMASFDELLDELLDGSRLYTTSRVSPGLPLPAAYVERIERVPGVRTAYAGVNFSGYYQLPENSFGGEAFDVSQRSKDGFGDFVVSEAALSALSSTRTGALVGAQLAEQFGWKVGDRLPLHLATLRKDRSNVWLFDIVGTWDAPPGTGRVADQVWVNYDFFDESRAVNNGTVSSIITHVHNPSEAGRVGEELDRLFANSDAETYTQSFAAAIRAEIDQVLDIQLIVNAVLSAVFFTLLFVSGNTMMQSVRERIPEFGVLRTYGFPNAMVVGLALVESLVLCVFAAVVGILAASELLFPWIFAAFSMDPLPMPIGIITTGVAWAVVLAIVTALPPVLRAVRLSIVASLAAR